MTQRLDAELTVNANGTQVTSSAASAVVAIPNAADGARARHLRIQSTGACYVRPGGSGTTCTNADILLTGGGQAILNVQGFTHIAYLQESAGAKINLTPLEVG
jgi:hypothetical protein